MIEVVERKGVPVYETECYECKSKLRYTRADMHTLAFIDCPVCGVSIHVIPTNGSQVAFIGGNGELPIVGEILKRYPEPKVRRGE